MFFANSKSKAIFAIGLCCAALILSGCASFKGNQTTAVKPGECEDKDSYELACEKVPHGYVRCELDRSDAHLEHATSTQDMLNKLPRETKITRYYNVSVNGSLQFAAWRLSADASRYVVRYAYQRWGEFPLQGEPTVLISIGDEISTDIELISNSGKATIPASIKSVAAEIDGGANLSVANVTTFIGFKGKDFSTIPLPSGFILKSDDFVRATQFVDNAAEVVRKVVGTESKMITTDNVSFNPMFLAISGPQMNRCKASDILKKIRSERMGIDFTKDVKDQVTQIQPLDR